MPTTKPKSRTEPPWVGYVVLNADKVALGVYGSALSVEAHQQADKVRQQVPGAVVSVKKHTAVTRPHVGDVIA